MSTSTPLGFVRLCLDFLLLSLLENVLCMANVPYSMCYWAGLSTAPTRSPIFTVVVAAAGLAGVRIIPVIRNLTGTVFAVYS